MSNPSSQPPHSPEIDPQDAPRRTPQDSTQYAPQQTPQDAPQRAPQDSTQHAPLRTPLNAVQRARQADIAYNRSNANTGSNVRNSPVVAQADLDDPFVDRPEQPGGPAQPITPGGDWQPLPTGSNASTLVGEGDPSPARSNSSNASTVISVGNDPFIEEANRIGPDGRTAAERLAQENEDWENYNFDTPPADWARMNIREDAYGLLHYTFDGFNVLQEGVLWHAATEDQLRRWENPLFLAIEQYIRVRGPYGVMGADPFVAWRAVTQWFNRGVVNADLLIAGHRRHHLDPEAQRLEEERLHREDLLYQHAERYIREWPNRNWGSEIPITPYQLWYVTMMRMERELNAQAPLVAPLPQDPDELYPLPMGYVPREAPPLPPQFNLLQPQVIVEIIPAPPAPVNPQPPPVVLEQNVPVLPPAPPAPAPAPLPPPTLFQRVTAWLHWLILDALPWLMILGFVLYHLILYTHRVITTVPPMPNHYGALNVPPHASTDEIHQTFNATLWPGLDAREAYATLTDPVERCVYDSLYFVPSERQEERQVRRLCAFIAQQARTREQEGCDTYECIYENVILYVTDTEHIQEEVVETHTPELESRPRRSPAQKTKVDGEEEEEIFLGKTTR